MFNGTNWLPLEVTTMIQRLSAVASRAFNKGICAVVIPNKLRPEHSCECCFKIIDTLQRFIEYNRGKLRAEVLGAWVQQAVKLSVDLGISISTTTASLSREIKWS